MARRRNPARPPIKLSLWKKDGDLWFAERADLEAAVLQSGRSESDIKRQMGVGYSHLLDALEGKRIDGWAAAHIEWGIRSEGESKPCIPPSFPMQQPKLPDPPK